MRRPIIYSIVAILIFLTSGCQNKIGTRVELLNFIRDRDNGLFMEEKRSNILTSASYVPYELILAKDGTLESIHTKHAKKPSPLCFVIRFSFNGKELLSQLNPDDYGEIFQTLSLRMLPLVSLHLDGNETISASDCVFQQTYGLSSANELLLVFDSEKIANSKECKLMIDEFGLGLGELKYTFLKTDIDQLNKLLNM